MTYRALIAIGLPALLLAAPGTCLSQEGPPPVEEEGKTPPPQPEGTATTSGSPTIPFDLPVAPPGPEITLEEAIRMADERNLTIEATRTEIKRADAELYKAWAALFPSASAGMTYSHMDHANNANFGGNRITTQQQDNLSANIEVSVPIVNPISWAGISAARTGLDVASITVENARQTLLLTVAQSYYQALTIKSQIDVLEEQIDAAARHHEIARTRLVSGVGERLDVLRAKGDLVRLRENLIATHASLTSARDSLGILTGTEGLPMPADAPPAAPPAGKSGELEDQAMQNREDLKMKEAVIELSEKQLTIAWMQFLPTLNGSWQLTHQFTEIGAIGDSDKTRWTAYLMLSVPIYSQTRYADLDIKRAAIRRAEIEAEDAQRNAAKEVRSAKRDYDTALDKISTAAEQAQLARESLTLTENSYVLGTGSSLAVTDARRTCMEAEINLAMRQLEAQLSLLKLLRAIGTDITDLERGR